MKFTEGYWLRRETAEAHYAAQAYAVEALPDGLRVLSPARVIVSRGDTLNTATITTEFTHAAPGVIAVRSRHHEAYERREPRFDKTARPTLPVTVRQDENEAVMEAGAVTLRIDKKRFGYRFYAGGELLTGCGFHNLAYIQDGKKPATMSPSADYMKQDYEPYMVTELSLAPDECVYGLGERFTAFVKNGQTVDMWNEDGGTSSQIAYKNIPFYLTNKNYAVFVDHTTDVSFEVASEKVECVGFAARGEEIRYYLIYGADAAEILERYTALTGRPALPPAWSFGLWLSTSFTTSYDEGTATGFISGMAERGIPLSVFHYDCFWMKEFTWCDFEWDERVFPDVPAMLRRNHERGLRLCCWINPYVAQGTAFFREGAEKGYFLLRRDGRGVWQTDHWQPGMAVVDFTNPDAARWYAEKLRALLRMGVDCFKTDFGERIPTDVSYFNGADPVGMHNYYTYLYNRCVFRLLCEERGAGEAVVFARSATAGGQQFPVHWGGDNSASYPSMAETLRGGLSFAMSGFSFWSNDISGFEQTAPPDLFKRWVQFGLLCTHSRLHGSTSYRVPWAFDDEAVQVTRFFAKLKCRLMPYLYAMAVKAHETGLPMMRPMVLEFYGDPAVTHLDRQYMLGDSLLVAPVFREDGRADYYLPDGEWTELLTGGTRWGGHWQSDSYDYFSLPLYVRQNTLLAVGGTADRPDYDYADGLTLHLYALQPWAEARCTVPDLTGAVALEAAVTSVGGASGSVVGWQEQGAPVGALELRLSRPVPGLRLVLHGIDAEKIDAVEGGALSDSDGTDADDALGYCAEPGGAEPKSSAAALAADADALGRAPSDAVIRIDAAAAIVRIRLKKH
ncbi:MAG: alpha-xylosidase [Clostridiales bacterium]|jgi:alpha-D-xyloside xylohydrolase|nr:alpha-xylosidase [Clostridiales bacterium]